MEEKAQNIFNFYKKKNLLEEVPENQIEQYKKSCDNIFGKGMSESFLALAGNKKRKRQDVSRYVYSIVPSFNTLLDIHIKHCKFAIIYNTNNEFLLLGPFFTPVISKEKSWSKHRKISGVTSPHSLLLEEQRKVCIP